MLRVGLHPRAPGITIPALALSATAQPGSAGKGVFLLPTAWHWDVCSSAAPSPARLGGNATLAVPGTRHGASQQKCSWAPPCPCQPANRRTLQLFRLVDWKLVNCAEALLGGKEWLGKWLAQQSAWLCSHHGHQAPRGVFLLKVNTKPLTSFPAFSFM